MRALLVAAGLDVPPERHELLTQRFGPVLALTLRLSRRMRDMDGVPPAFSVHVNSSLGDDE